MVDKISKIIQLLKLRNWPVKILLVVSLVGSFYFLRGFITEFEKLSVLNGGIKTCFYRVGQSFTALMIKDFSSTYLSKNFYSATEECFGEALILSGKDLSQDTNKYLKKLNSLSSEVHWFHRQLYNPQDTTDNSDLKRMLSNKFSTMESKVGEIIDYNDGFKNKKLKLTFIFGWVFYSLSALLFLVLVWNYVILRNRQITNKYSEELARMELSNLNDQANSTKASSIIANALVENDLEYCSDLFLKFHVHGPMNRNDKHNDLSDINYKRPKKVMRVINSYFKNMTGNINSADASIISSKEQEEDKNSVRKDLKVVDIKSVFEKVLELLQEKIFLTSVIVDLDLVEDAYVKANGEILEQVIYQMMQYSLASFDGVSASNDLRKVVITVHKKHDKIDITFQISNKNGLNVVPEKQIELEICKELIQEISGNMSFSNVGGKQDKTVEMNAVLTFLAGKKIIDVHGNSKLVALKKGKKKDILNEFFLD